MSIIMLEEVVGKKRLNDKNEPLFLVLNRLLQMIDEEEFVRDKQNTIYYKDDIILQYLNRFTDCKIAMTEYFFNWYLVNYKDEFHALKENFLNVSIKTVHLFLSNHENMIYFPLVKINEDIKAYRNGYYDSRTKRFFPSHEMDRDVFVTFYMDTDFEGTINKRHVTFSDQVSYFG